MKIAKDILRNLDNAIQLLFIDADADVHGRVLNNLSSACKDIKDFDLTQAIQNFYKFHLDILNPLNQHETPVLASKREIQKFYSLVAGLFESDSRERKAIEEFFNAMELKGPVQLSKQAIAEILKFTNPQKIQKH